MGTSWIIAIDWDRDGKFVDANDDVTNRIISAQWFIGARLPYQNTANDSTLELVLDNEDRRYSPDYLDPTLPNHPGSPLNGKLLPQRPVKISSVTYVTDVNGNQVVDAHGDPLVITHTHWVGWLESIQPATGEYGERTVEIDAIGAFQYLKAAEANVPLQENKRTDEIVNLLIQEVVMPPALSLAWVLGRENCGNLGVSTYLADILADSQLETGQLTLAIAADNWIQHGGPNDIRQNNFDVYHAIGDVMAAERGRFFFDREGRAVFWNRHHLLYDWPVDASFNDEMSDLSYAFAGNEQVKNELIVICHPRKISANSDNVLWDLGDSVIKVKKGAEQTTYLSFQDGDGTRLAGRDLTINNLTFQQGTAMVTLEEKATGTLLHLDNSTGTQDAIVKSCTIKGTKITDYDQMQATSSDQSSVTDYGKRTMRINLPSIDNLDDAQSIAEFELARRKDPRGMAQALSLRSHGTLGGLHHVDQLALTIGDRINVQETQTAHNDSYFIIGETHKLTNGAALLETTWYLEPVPKIFPWRLGAAGYSELGAKTTVTY